MALIETPQGSQSVYGAIKGALGLFSDLNKATGITENSNPSPIEEYESTLTETEIIELVSQWVGKYNVYYDPIKKGQELAFDYWVGKHRNPDTTGSSIGTAPNIGVTDNLIFEAIETFLPIATRANPEPLVTGDPSDLGQRVAKDIRVALVHEADTQLLRRKLARVTRDWLLNRIGVVKVSWNPQLKQIETTIIPAKRMIFDSKGSVDERGYFTGQYVGERKRAPAEDLIKMFPGKTDIIKAKSQGKMGTMLDYIEWWYCSTDVFYTLDKTVLGKFKNPNWNYDGKVKDRDPETGAEVESFVQGVNHLKEPTYPYRFLAIFSTGEQPHDNTSLVLQNIPQQDKINRREVQIDKNVEGMNNGIVVSGTAFTEEQAAQAASALRRGVAIRVPNGDVGKAVLFPQRPDLPSDVFGQLKDARSELRNIFGTSGSTPEGVKSQETVRGKILINQMDASRIGGGITEFIEQLADSIYNLWVQMMFVYYDEEHFITSAGTMSGMELITLKNDKFIGLKTLSITVKEGSLIPKDPLTQRNEAIDLWSANAIDPYTLYKKLDVPNPEEATSQLIAWQMLQKGQIQPQQYLPSFALAGQTPNQTQLPTTQPGTGGPAINPGIAQPTGQQPPTPQSPESVTAQSQQLIRSVPENAR